MPEENANPVPEFEAIEIFSTNETDLIVRNEVGSWA
jgi:hypothetical protein